MHAKWQRLKVWGIISTHGAKFDGGGCVNQMISNNKRGRISGINVISLQNVEALSVTNLFM